MTLAQASWTLAFAFAAAGACAGGLDPEPAPGGAADPEAALGHRTLGPLRALLREDRGTSPPGAEVVLTDPEGRTILRLGDLPGAGRWTFWDVGDIAASDVDGDGAADLVAVVEYVTGIGPAGADPFPQAAVLLQRPEGFVRDAAREAAANEGALAGGWSTAEALAARLRDADG